MFYRSYYSLVLNANFPVQFAILLMKNTSWFILIFALRGGAADVAAGVEIHNA